MKRGWLAILLLLVVGATAQGPPPPSPPLQRTAPTKEGNNTFTGSNTFTRPVTVGEPTADSHAATQNYVKLYVAANGAGGDAAIKYADKQTGATPADKINSAATAATASETTQGVVWVPSTLGGTGASSYSATTPASSGAMILDFRGCRYNLYANEAGCGKVNGAFGPFFRQRIAEPKAAPNQDTYQNVQIHQDVETGGTNTSAGPVQKSNFNAFWVSQLSYTPGQHFGSSTVMFNGSHGDTFGNTTLVTQWGSTNAAGDEAEVGVAGYAYQGSEEFTGTVSSVSGNTIFYTGGYAEYSRGELRYLLNTSRNIYSTGTISSITNVGGTSGYDATVIGSGTSWNTLCPGNTAPCTASGQFFSLDGGNSYSTQLYVIRVKTINSATSLTLTWDAPGMTSGPGWAGDASTGTYKLYKGATVTRVWKTGAVDVDVPGNFQAADGMRMPLGNMLGQIAIRGQSARYIPGGWTNATALLQNVGPRPQYTALQLQGKYTDSMIAMYPTTDGASLFKAQGPTRYAITLYNTVDDATITSFQVNRNAASGGMATQAFQKNSNSWVFTGGNLLITAADNTSNYTLFQASDSAGVVILRVQETAIVHNNSMYDVWYSGNFGAETARIIGSSGQAKFTSIRTEAANPAATGFLQLASGDVMKIRNNANGADLNLLSKGTDDVVQLGDTAGVKLVGPFTANGANGETWVRASASELITLSTSGTTTDSSANLLPAGALIKAVVCRVTTAITTATDWAVGDATTSARFCSANSTRAAGTQAVCLNHQKGSVATDAAGPTQASAAKLRITTTGTPGAGVVRCTVDYEQFTAPTS